MHLLIQSHLCQVGGHLLGQVGLPGANGGGAAQSQIVVEALTIHSPRVKQPLQAPAVHTAMSAD